MGKTGAIQTFSERNWTADDSAAYVDTDASYVTNLNVPSASVDSFEAVDGIGVDRGFLASWSMRVLDWSKFEALENAMVAHTLKDIKVTYIDGSSKVLKPCRHIVTPVVAAIGDTAEVFLGAAGLATVPATDASNWLSLKAPLQGAQLSLSMQEETDDQGRPYFGLLTMGEITFILPGATYDSLDSHVRQNVKLACALPDGGYRILTGRLFRYRTDENGRAIRGTRVVLRCKGTRFTGQGGFISWLNAAAAAYTPPNDINGFDLRAVGMGYHEDDVLTLASA
ncbi:MAG: hypothetical protein AAGJ10_20565 [Bacteroidota bacterium]